MVQFFRGSPDPRSELVGQLGSALGMGMGNALKYYQADRALNEVVDNKENENLPMGEKMGLLERALRPYGETGQKMLMNRIAIEQQRQQEQQQKQQRKQSSVLGKLLNGQQVSEEERSSLTPDQQLAYAKHQAAINKQPKQAISQQPIDPDQLKRIKETRQQPEFLSASPTRKYQMLTENGVSSPLAEAESKIAAEELKNQPGQAYTKKRELTIEDYTTNALAGLEESENMQSTMETIEKAIQGDITEPGIMAAIKHDPYGQLFFGLTPDEATLTAANKYMLEGTKGIWGSKPTEKEMFTLLNGMLPSIGKTKEANLAGLQVIKKSNNLKRIKGEIVDRLTDGGKNFVPDIESLVNKEMKPYIDEFRKEAYNLKGSLDHSEKVQKEMSKQGKVRVRSPDGRPGYMTQQQIDAAKAKNVIFTPI